MNNELLKDFEISIEELKRMLFSKKKNYEITVVGGFAIYLLDNNFDRITIDINVLSNIKNIDLFGFSSQVEVVKGDYGNYKNDRILLDKYSSSNLKVFVISPERIITSKKIANRNVLDKEDIEYLYHNFDVDEDKITKYILEKDKSD